MILELIGFFLFSLMAFLFFSFNANLITGVSLFILKALTSLFPSTYVCYIFAVPIILCIISLWSIVVILPLLCVPFRFSRKWYKANVSRMLFVVLKVVKCLTIGFLVSFIFAVFGAPELSIAVGSIATICFMNKKMREIFSVAIGFLIPSFLCKALVGHSKIIIIDDVVALKTRRLFQEWTVGFIKVGRLPSIIECSDRLRSIILGAHASEMSLGYGIKFGDHCSTLFFVGMGGLYNRVEKISENLSILKEIILPQLPTSSVEILCDPEELQSLLDIEDDIKIKIRGNVLELLQEKGTTYFGAVRISGRPSSNGKNSFMALIETLRRGNNQATYMVSVIPVNENPIRYNMAKHGYQRDNLEKGRGILETDNFSFSKVAVAIFLRNSSKKELKISVKSVKAAILSEFSSELSRIQIADVRGLDLLESFSMFRFSSFSHAGTIMTINDASKFVKLPSTALQEASKVSSILSVATRKNYNEELVLGRIICGSNSLNRIAKLPIHLLNKHMLVTGDDNAGKENFVKQIILQLANRFNVNVLILDPTGEYHKIASELKGVRIFNPVVDDISVNILEIPKGVEKDVHIENIVRNLHILIAGQNSSYDELVRLSLQRLYELNLHPRLSDLVTMIKDVAASSNFKEPLDLLYSHLEKMTVDVYGRIFDQSRTSFQVESLLATPVIIELHEMTAWSQAFFIEAILAMIQDFRKINGPAHNVHLICLGEGYLFAPKIFGTKAGIESVSDCPAAMTLKEMQRCNEGVILICQRPSTVATDALVNCNSLIAFRLKDKEDANIIVSALGYSSYREMEIRLTDYMTKLENGHCIFRTSITETPIEIETGSLTVVKEHSDGSRRIFELEY